MRNNPKVSIGLPVFNGEKNLVSALKSLILQTYSNLEIIICDNCSTDRTAIISKKFAEKDKRINYIRNSSNIGASRNFNKVFHLSQGDFFMWVAHDDILDPTYIEKCVIRLQEYPEAIVCISDITMIDEEGKTMYVRSFPETVGRNVIERVEKALSPGLFIYGLYRPEFLKKTGLFREIYGPDIVLGIELAIIGEVTKVSEPLFYYRNKIHPKTTEILSIEITANKIIQNEIVQAPYFNMIKGLSGVIHNSGLMENSKRKLIETLINCVLNNYSWRIFILHELSKAIDKRIVTETYFYQFLNSYFQNDVTFSEAIESTDALLDVCSVIEEHRPIFIWGVKESAEIGFTKCILKGYRLSGFIDETGETCGSKLFGLQIYSPETIPLISKPYIICLEKDRSRMLSKFRGLCFEEGIDYALYDNFPLIC